MYKALDLAKYMVAKCTKDGYPITHLQLQKMLYFLQAYFLVNLSKPAFSEEIEAWRYGPVVRCVYNEYSCYGYSKIYETFDSYFEFEQDTDKEVADYAIEKLRKYSASELVEKSHKVGSPWDLVYYNKIKNNKNTISCDLIKEYYGSN